MDLIIWLVICDTHFMHVDSGNPQSLFQNIIQKHQITRNTVSQVECGGGGGVLHMMLRGEIWMQ